MMIETSADVGAELARYLKATEGTGSDPDECAQIVGRLVAAPCLNSTDAVALLSWAVVTMSVAINAMPEDEPGVAGVPTLLAEVHSLMQSALSGLERETGIPREAFIGSSKPAN